MLRAFRRLVAPTAVALVLGAAALLAAEAIADTDDASSRPAALAASAPNPSAVPLSRRSRIAVIVMENKGYRQVIGSPAAPYLNSLARHYASATRFYAVAHPSLPNYLALTAGSPLGTHTDRPGVAFEGPNLLTQLSSAGFSWKAYVAGVPSTCYLGARAPGYVKALNPFVYFEQITQDPARCSRIVPSSRLFTDLRTNSVPDLSWITPSLCQDTHRCGVRTGDRFLSKLVPSLLRELGPHGALFILWDEGTTNRGCCGSSGGGRVPALFVGPDVRADTRITAPINQYSVLRTLESAFGVSALGSARSASPGPIESVFARPPSVRPPTLR